MTIEKSRIHLLKDKSLCDSRFCRFKLCNMVISVPIVGAWPEIVGYDVAAPIRIYATPNAVTLMSLEPPEGSAVPPEEPKTPPKAPKKKPPASGVPKNSTDDLGLLFSPKQ